jgi:hypothetical protein
MATRWQTDVLLVGERAHQALRQGKKKQSPLGKLRPHVGGIADGAKSNTLKRMGNIKILLTLVDELSMVKTDTQELTINLNQRLPVVACCRRASATAPAFVFEMVVGSKGCSIGSTREGRHMDVLPPSLWLWQ